MSQYMYDWDRGPVVWTKKYGKKLLGYRESFQSILPGFEPSNCACMTIDQMYTPRLRITTMNKPIWALLRWLNLFMSRIKPRPKQPTLKQRQQDVSASMRWRNSSGRGTYMQKNGEMSEDKARARTVKYVAKYVDQVPLQLLSALVLVASDSTSKWEHTRRRMSIKPIEQRAWQACWIESSWWAWILASSTVSPRKRCEFRRIERHAREERWGRQMGVWVQVSICLEDVFFFFFWILTYAMHSIIMNAT